MNITTPLFTRMVAIALLAGSQLSVSNQSSEAASSLASPIQPSSHADCVTWDFRYLITLDHQMSSALRKIEVFMEPTAFTEANLQKLFRYLSDKNPDTGGTRNLHISVVTDWKQLGLPSDCPPSGTSVSKAVKPSEFHSARFYRRGEKEFFTFNPDRKSYDTKDVIMKGSEIFRNGAWQPPF